MNIFLPDLGGPVNPSFNSLTLTAPITPSQTTGALSYGALTYADTNTFAVFETSVNSYGQMILQNASNGAVASIDYVVSNDLGTATAFYGNFGMNSSGFTGAGSFNIPSAVYLTATSGDLVLGTTTAKAIRFVVNSGTADAMTISAGNVVSLLNALPGASGGTGVANTGKTVTLGGNLTTAGAFDTTLTATATSNATLPAGTTTLAPVPTVAQFTNSGSFVKKSTSTIIAVLVVGGGGGGGFGGTFAAATGGSGGGGGSAAGIGYQIFRAADVAASVTITIGAGAPGGAGGVVPTNGSLAGQGGQGGISSFGTQIYGGGGGGGGPGSSLTTSGGAGGSSNYNFQGAFGTAIGGPGSGFGNSGGTGTTGSQSTFGPGTTQGAPGTSATGQANSSSQWTWSAAAGGSGGGFNASGTPFVGGNAGSTLFNSLAVNVTGGAINTPSPTIGGLSNTLIQVGPFYSSGSGAGGGAGFTTNGGTGGSGGLFGAAGGGGGAGNSTAGFVGGVGGAGGAGVLWVWEW